MNIYTYDEYEEALKLGKTVDNDIKMYRTMCDPIFITFIKQKHKANKQYVYLYTFTLEHTQYPEDDVEKYIIKQIKSPRFKILSCNFVKEYTKKGVAHWHACIFSEDPIETGQFWYYAKKYGFVHNSKDKTKLKKLRKNPQKYDDILKYLNKKFISTKII